MERKLIAIAVATGLGLPMAADAVEGSASGHVNAAIVKVDDGDATLGSGNGSETRFRFTGSEELDSGLTVGVTLELGAGGGTYGYGADANSDTRVRHANVSLSSAGGKVTIGQQNRPSGGASYADVGSTWIAGATNWCSYGIGGGAACVNQRRIARQVVRYDSSRARPGLHRGLGSGTTTSGMPLPPSPVPRAMPATTFASDTTALTGPRTSSSGSVTVGTIGVAAAWSDGENMDNNEHMFTKLDHTYGDGSVAVYYRRGEVRPRKRRLLWGVGVAHSIGGGATAYAGYRIIDNDGADEVDGVLAGVRVTF